MANEEMRGIVGGQGGHGGQHGGGFVVRMMTDEQIQQLRKQISIYAVLTEQLIEMYYAVLASQEPTAAAGPSPLRSLYNPLLGPGGAKLTARQRWSPSPVQLEILETIFRQGHGSPCKQKIKEITAEVARHGRVSETNVYNWFQNRRARLKRKQQQQQAATVHSNSSTRMITNLDKDYHDNINVLMVDNYSNNSTQ
ncbi:WUSCHEL-related homeobox 8-like [Typha angustifolia]|uniref:WUSCHEL-related homeobox 8-like n=1 Tax=Typha angustifolia TaxID=59011 RepID=UPI003C2E9438